MSSDIIMNLQLDKELTSSKVIVVKEINGCDSSFITSCILGDCIKKKHALLIITTHNSLLHYQNVGLKMNYNVQKYIDSGLIKFYNLSQDCVNNLLSNKRCALTYDYSRIYEMFLSMKEHHNAVNIILEGVTHLFDLEYTLREVNNFCNDLSKLLRKYDNSFVLFHNNVVSDNDVSHVMSNLLAHKAHTVLEVENLPSGLSADVSGHLTIKHPGKKFESEHMFILDQKPAKYLFKLFDRGVKLFAPGTV